MKNILIVDDVKGWRDFNTNVMFELFGHDINIDTAESATKAYDIILTDLQMEESYAPKYAGEWLVEQIKTFNIYNSTKIVMVSASYNIRHIADNLEVECIPKSTALKCFSAYEELLK